MLDRSKNTVTLSIVLGLALAGLLWSCKQRYYIHHLRPGIGDVRYGGTYRINMLRGNPNGLDPVLITSKLADDIALQIFDRLVTFDSLLNVQPELAHRWEISTDGTRYTFHLRTDVRFHDDPCFPNGRGRSMTAHDVVYSLTRACDPLAKTTAFWIFKDKVRGATRFYTARALGDTTVRRIEGISAPNDSTVTIELERPYAPFLQQLANAFGCIVPPEAIEYYGENFFRHPVGTGPFRLHWWKDDYGMLLVRNEHYWQRDEFGNQLPYLDSLFITFIKDDKVQLQQFLDGHLEESYSIPTELFDVFIEPQTRTLKAGYPFHLQVKPALLTWFIDFHCARPPFWDRKLRQALSWAIDRERLVRFVLRNAPWAAATHGVTPPVIPGYDISHIKGYGFDPVRARHLLAQCRDVPKSIVLHVYPEPRLLQVAEAIQSMVAEHLGIELRIEVIQFAQFLDMAERGKLTMWGTRWYGDYPDVENYLSLFDGSLVPHDDNTPSYPNSTRYRNDTVSALLQHAASTTDPTIRSGLYLDAEQQIMNDAPAAMLFYETHYRLVQPYIRNYPLDAMARPILKRVWFAW